MATCAKCGAKVPEDSLFCVECGEKVDGALEVDLQETEELKKIKKGLLGGLKKKKGKAPKVLDADIKEEVSDTLDEKVTLEGEEDPTFESIEDEAKDWAEGADEAKSKETLEEPPVLTTDETKEHFTPDKRVVPKAVFIARNKNGLSDKTFGLLIFAIIVAIIAIAFVFNPSLLNYDGIIKSAGSFAPLFLIALAGLLVARTGNIDLSLPGIAIVTYFMLMHGFNTENFYTMLILCFAGAIGVGLVSGLLATIGKIPSVFTGLGLLTIALTYVSTIIADSAEFVSPIYTQFTVVYIPMAIIILSLIAAFVLIYLSRLGKSIYKRKGLTGKDKLLYVLTFVLAAVFAAAAGFVGSIFTVLPATMTDTFFLAFDYIVGMLFILAICGSSTWFDNRAMPVIMLIVAFLTWFGIDIIINGSVFAYSKTLTAAAVKLGFLILALIGERVYTKLHLPDYYQTINVKR
jgi:hypothetical protein